MKYRTILALAVVALSHARVGAAEVVARVGDTKITSDEIAGSLQTLPEADRAALSKNPAMLSEYVRSVLVQRLVLQEARKKDWENQAVVLDRMERLREGIVAETFLASVAKPEAGFPSDEQLEAAYAANKDALRIPRQWNLAQIFVSRDARKKLAEVQQKLAANGADFAELAQNYSDEPSSAAQGGKIGLLSENLLQPEIRTALITAKAGRVTNPIEMTDGWHIVKGLGIEEPSTPTLAQIRPQLTERLRAERTKVNAKEYVTKLLQDNPVVINELALSQTLESAPR